MGTSVKTSAGLAGLLVSGSSLAEPYGLSNGQTADSTGMSDRSVEFGAVRGDLGDVDYEHFGARFNYRLSPETRLTCSTHSL